MDSPFSSGDRNGNGLKFDLSDRFSSDILKMFREGSFNDVCIKLHDGEIKANKSVLAARCEYFAAAIRWKENNNHEVEKIVVNDCSKKIMTRIIEFIFTGILKADDLNLLEFLELKDQVRKMFPGDILVGQLEDILKFDDDRYYSFNPILTILPTNEEIAKAISLIKTENLQPEVMDELARTIESSIWQQKYGRGQKWEERIRALANLVSYGVIESLQHLRLDLRLTPGDHLQELISSVTGTVDISSLEDNRLATLFDAVDCKELHLLTEILNQEETEALVRAMTTRVEILRLNLHMEWDMAYDTFSKYKGDGKCTELHINDCPDYHLSPLLDSVNFKELHLHPFTGSKNLSQGETEALVRAMTSRVEIVHLGGSKDGVTLDFETLKMYKGDGKCREVHCNGVSIGWSWLLGVDGDILGRKDKWLTDESAATWAEQMNWDLKVKIQNCEYLLSRKKTV